MITIMSHHLNAVQACINPQDPRPYFNGFFIDTENRVIVGTDGHILLAAPYEGSGPGGIYKPLKLPARKIPYSVTLSETLAYTVNAQALPLEPITGVKYPVWQRVLASTPVEVGRMTFNPQLLAPIAKALNDDCRMECDTGDRLRITWLENPDLVCTLMSVRDRKI